jgi:hypothetical protein
VTVESTDARAWHHRSRRKVDTVKKNSIAAQKSHEAWVIRPSEFQRPPRRGDATESPTAAQIVRLDDYRRPGVTDFAYPPDDTPDDYYKPILIAHNCDTQIGIMDGDLCVAHLTRAPKQGQFSYVEVAGDFLLGYYFTEPDGTIRVEAVCTLPCCPPEHLTRAEVETAAPIRWLRFARGGAILQVPFESFRREGVAP